MEKKPHLEKPLEKNTSIRRWLLGWFKVLVVVSCLVCLVALSLVMPEAENVIVFTVFSLLILGVLYVVIADDVQVKKKRRRLRLERVRQDSMKAAEANLKAQLSKPDFETRLQMFVKEEPVHQYIEPESKMEFWEREEADYALTPTRPIELLRYLMQRISKLVGQSR